MGNEPEVRDEQWANTVAWWTFLFTVIGAALFAAAVFLFIF